MRETKTSSHRLSSRKALALIALALAGALAAVSFPWLATRAQRSSREPVVQVTNVSARPTAGGEVVSLTADAPLSRAQTWQDEEGFHVVGYKWVGSFAAVPHGVKVRRVGDSLELVIPTRTGAGVTVVPRGSGLDVVVSGGLTGSASEQRTGAQTTRQQKAVQAQPQPREVEAQPRSVASADTPRASSRTSSFIASKEKSVAAARELIQAGGGGLKNADARAQSRSAEQPAAPPTLFKSAQTISQPNAATENAATQNAQAQSAPTQDSVSTPTAGAVTPESTQQASPTESQPSAPAPVTPTLADEALSISEGYSLWAVVALLCVGLAVFFFIRHRRRTAATGQWEERAPEQVEKSSKANKAKSAEVARREEKGARVAAKAETGNAPATPGGKVAQATPASPMQFGAFRVDQEVDKLVRGEAHDIDVLASRASEDRRAVEASLLKALASPELIESERERARTALEEYGFVARQSAAVLLAPDAYGRSAAARSLGQIKSAASLPFLLEALYDADTVVRAEAVTSLGSLGLPRAIGALLDVARRHPEIPPALVTDALNACSLDALDFQGLGLVGDKFTGEINALEPIADVDQLPEWLEDETLAEALERLRSSDVEARVAAAHQLAQFQVRRAVEALASMAANDRDASVRAAAVTSLGLINHESVFAAILIAMADESREVRAAAARALSRLNFDRADAYVRVLETADAETLRRTAEACVTAGLARQAMDRLASDDRRQAYEAFSLLSLVARGGQTEVIVHVVKGHPDLNVRLAASRLLALQGDEEVNGRLRQIALEGNTPEKLREAIMEVCERRSQPRGAASADATNESDKSLHGIA